MKKNIFILLFVFYTLGAFSQQKSDENNFVIKINYSNVNSHQIIPDFTNTTTHLKEFIYKKNAQYNFEGLYGINKIWSVGVYFGYSKGTFISNKITDSGIDYISATMDKYGKSYFYGLESNIQLLPLLLKSENLRLNVYCPIKIGMVSQQITSMETNTKVWENPVLEFGAGLGLSYYFTKNIGIFGEYQLGRFYNDRYTQWKAGLTIKF